MSLLRKSQWKTGVTLTVQVALCFLIQCHKMIQKCLGFCRVVGVSVTDEFFIKMTVP